MLAEEKKWQALLACDPTYDGIFYYGVKTTGIFCRPSCKSKSPKRENVTFFDTGEQALENGFRPCKRCRPDLLEFQPQRETAEQIKGIYDLHFSDHHRLNEELKELGLSRNRMIQLFQEQYGKTPVQYLNELRIVHAQKLLADTRDNILQIALQSGFDSLSAFYSRFRRITGVSPKKYRDQSPLKKESE